MASKFQTKVIKDYERRGWYVINLIKTNKNGSADLLCLKDGEKPEFVECKEKDDVVSPLQLYRGREVEKRGFVFKLLQDA